MIEVSIKLPDSILRLDMRAVETAVVQANQMIAGQIRRVIMNTFRGRTGALARSWREVSHGPLKASVRSDLVYANIQDRGGTIKPKTVSRLAIPLNPNIAVGKWPRHWGKGQLVLTGSVLSTVSKRKMAPQYALVKSVTLRGRDYVDRAIREIEPEVQRVIEGEIVVSS